MQNNHRSTHLRLLGLIPISVLLHLQLIREIIDEYPYLAMDTEFPGVVARPMGNFKNSGEYHYQTLR